MKLFLISALLLTLCPALLAMELLTPEETKCFIWFEANPLTMTAYKSLAENEKNILSKGTLYREHPEAVKNAMFNLAKNLKRKIQQENDPLRYDAEFLGNTLLKIKIALQNKKVEKPIDLTTARLYVFSKLLTPEEKATILKENYIKNPEATRIAMTKYADLVMQELVTLGLVTPQDRSIAAAAFLQKKMNELQEIFAQ